MKKLLITILLIVFMVPCFVFAGEVTDQLDQMKAQQEQIERARQAWTQLEYAYRALTNCNAAVQKIVDDGDLDLLPTKLKVTLNAAWTEYKACLAALNANPDIVECFQWSGNK